MESKKANKQNQTNELDEIFSEFNSLPYLFIGSGLSRRYLGLEDWKGLLKHFVSMINNKDLAFESYLNDARTELKNKEVYDESLLLPMVASLLETDFNKLWFADDSFSEGRKNYKIEVELGASPFKIEIAEHIKKMSDLSNLNKAYIKEYELLSTLADKSINGVITTNYDLLIQDLFNDKDYDTYVGQDELMFSSINGIRDIYKIHGCCNEPSSVLITYEDYVDFRERKSYIAAKLLTLFVEHPIVFIGYSIEDPHIINILESIVDCVNEKNIDKLTNRLFFIQRSKDGDTLNVVDYIRHFKKASIPMKKVELNDFGILYNAILNVKAKYNPKLLKALRKDIYDLVLTNESSGRLIATADIDDKNLENVDVVIGVGLKSLAKKGLVGISAIDIFKDILMDTFDFLAYPEFKSEFVNKTLCIELSRTSRSLPVFKYIQDIDKLPYTIEDYIDKKTDLDSFLSENLKRQKKWIGKPKTISEVLAQDLNLRNQLLSIAVLDEDQINLDELKSYLLDIINNNEDIFDDKHSTGIKRLIKIYDFLKYNKKTEAYPKAT